MIDPHTKFRTRKNPFAEISPFYCCIVCGLDTPNPPWGEEGYSPTFEICECCGIEFGYHDSSLEGIARERKRWIDSNYKWDEEEYKPANWSALEQMKNIPELFRNIDQLLTKLAAEDQALEEQKKKSKKGDYPVEEISPFHNCLVCGRYMDAPPWGEDGLSPNFDLCPCCGTGFGKNDSSVESIARERKRWIDSDYRWDLEEYKPAEWSPQEQMKNIPPPFLNLEKLTGERVITQ